MKYNPLDFKHTRLIQTGYKCEISRTVQKSVKDIELFIKYSVMTLYTISAKCDCNISET